MTQAVTEAIAADVRAEAARALVDHAAIAVHLGCSRPTVTRRMAGTRPWPVADLVKLAAWWGIPIGRLIGDQLPKLVENNDAPGTGPGASRP